MPEWPQHEVFGSPRGRILCMDSVGYVDGRNDVTDVLVCGSHGAPCASQLLVWVRPRGVIQHDAGIGVGDGGVNGLALLDEYLIPGAMVACLSARISDGRDMYERGTISRVNRAARRMGAVEGMAAKQVAHLFLDRNPPPIPTPKRQILVHESDAGRVWALDTVKYVDARIAGGVLCMGSHAAVAMADYIRDLALPFAGVITNDAGRAADDSGIAGLPGLDELGIPGAAVSCDSARVGDAASTYTEGILSACNRSASALGVQVGMAATEAARLMLEGQHGRR